MLTPGEATDSSERTSSHAAGLEHEEPRDGMGYPILIQPKRSLGIYPLVN